MFGAGKENKTLFLHGDDFWGENKQAVPTMRVISVKTDAPPSLVSGFHVVCVVDCLCVSA